MWNITGFSNDEEHDPFAFELPPPKISSMDHSHHGGDHSMHAGHDMAGMVHDVIKAVVNGTMGSSMGHDHAHHMAVDGSTTHNHGAMTSHDHGAMTTHDHSGGDGTGHSMAMYFHFGYENETVLFEGWTLNSVEALIGTCIGVFFLAILYEGLKYFREYLYKRSATSVHYSSVSAPSPTDGASPVPKKGHSRSISETDGIITVQPVQMLSSSHFIQTILHLLQITLSYFLMLIVMTFNAWLMIAICAGAAVGYFLFGWSKAHVVDITEHCH